MEVTFDISKFPELVLAAKEILEYAAGKTASVDINMLETAISELERARKTCDEVELLQAA